MLMLLLQYTRNFIPKGAPRDQNTRLLFYLMAPPHLYITKPCSAMFANTYAKYFKT